MKRYVFTQGRLREVKDCWVWLFRLLDIGFDVPDKAVALAEALDAAEVYHRKCQIYFKAAGV